MFHGHALKTFVLNNSALLGFRSGSVVKNLPASAGDLVSIHGPGRSHMLSGATKPMRHNYWACALETRGHNRRSHHNEKPIQRNSE